MTNKVNTIAVAIAIAIVALAAGLYVHERKTYACGPAMGGGKVLLPICYRHPTWEDPAALLITVGGLIGATILVVRRPN